MTANHQTARAIPAWAAGARAEFNLSVTLLQQGDFAAAWPLYESRIDHPDWVPWAVRASITRHRDRLLRPGDALAGRDAVVFTEQGLGDNIMFARYLPLLAARGARVTLACGPALRPIFEHVEGIHALLTPPPAHPHGKLNLSALRFDVFAPLLSLPHALGLTGVPVSGDGPYLHVRAARVAAWRDHYAARGRPGRRRVGVVLQANVEGRSAPLKSMRISDVLPLAAIGGVDLVNLQHGPVGRALAAALPEAIDAIPEPVPLDEFAAAVAATDLLISIDTMAAHCAGAMGHPVWVALPMDPGWHWGPGRSACPWYPSAELFRQTTDRGWGGVAGTLCQRLRALPPLQ